MAETSEFFVVRRSSTSLSNKVIHDKEFSFSALGLLMVCLSLPSNALAGYRSFLEGVGRERKRSGKLCMSWRTSVSGSVFRLVGLVSFGR